MVDHHHRRESDKVVESDDVVEGRSGVAAHVPKDYGFWWRSVSAWGVFDGSSHVMWCRTHRLVANRGIALGYNVGLRRLLRRD